jgi:hypothetical protein
MLRITGMGASSGVDACKAAVLTTGTLPTAPDACTNKTPLQIFFARTREKQDKEQAMQLAPEYWHERWRSRALVHPLLEALRQ